MIQFIAALMMPTKAEIASVPVTKLTAPVSADADDPAIWVHPKDGSKSLIFGTDKIKEKGGIYAFNLNGKVVQRVENLDRPNNCDVEYGLGSMDILVVAERLKHRLRIYSINRTSGKLTDVSGSTKVFSGETGERREPMGIGLYKNRQSGRIFAVVSRAMGPTRGYLGYYELTVNPANRKVDAKLVRSFGSFSGKKEIESVFVDDELGNVYYSDETFGTRKYSLKSLDRELKAPDTKAFKGDHEGIALFDSGRGKGYIVCTEQIAGASRFVLFDRVTNRQVSEFMVPVDDTDGIEITSAKLGAEFPKGVFVAMNSEPKNFALVKWQSIADALKLPN